MRKNRDEWQRRREAKRRNRARRLDRYKTVKTYHGIIKAACRRYRQEITTPLIYCTSAKDEWDEAITAMQAVSVTWADGICEKG